MADQHVDADSPRAGLTPEDTERLLPPAVDFLTHQDWDQGEKTLAIALAAQRLTSSTHLRSAHYRPKEHPNAIRVVHHKTGEENWFPLFDEQTGAPFSADLVAELDAIKKMRIAGLMLRRDRGRHAPWPTWPTEGVADLTHMSRKVKEVIRAAGLRDELTFTSFRHGGFTEAGDAEMTDRELMAQGRHRSPKVLGKYVKRTMRQAAKGLRKRVAGRTDGGQLSE